MTGDQEKERRIGVRMPESTYQELLGLQLDAREGISVTIRRLIHDAARKRAREVKR
jgi:hypothetical protein